MPVAESTSIVITMAGLGSRFLKQGYGKPKFMIEVKGRTLFQWSMLSLSNIAQDVEWKFVTLAEYEAEPFILEECRALGIGSAEVVELEALTSGQAETALFAARLCRNDAPFLIYNIDTYVAPESFSQYDIRGDGWIPCFDKTGDHWSFVHLGEDGWATEVREKVRISNMCSIGLYWFKKTDMFLDAYDCYYGGGQLESGETYVAPLYNALIQKGRKISASMLPANNVIPLGTPEEVRAFEGS